MSSYANSEKLVDVECIRIQLRRVTFNVLGAAAMCSNFFLQHESNVTTNADPVEDQDHPIPRLDTLDVHVTTDKGAYVGIVIASPLKDDDVSRRRLQQKVEVSVGYFQSAEYREKYGAPCREQSRLWINVHCQSDATMLQLVEHYRTQIEANEVTAVVKLIGTN